MLVLERLDTAFKQNSRFEQLYRDFETQKVCYLPLTTFVLKPLHRLLQYQSLLQRLLKHYGPTHPDRSDCLTAIDTLKDLMEPVMETLEQSKNLATLCELQRDITGFENLVQAGRQFIRHGCLLKHSRKGYQQRMFFLVSSDNWNWGFLLHYDNCLVGVWYVCNLISIWIRSITQTYICEKYPPVCAKLSLFF